MRQQVPREAPGGGCVRWPGARPRDAAVPGWMSREGTAERLPAERLPALPALCRCLPFSSFKALPAALAPGSLICRATPRLPPLPHPRQGGGTGTPGEGTSPIPAPNTPEGAQAMGRLLLPLPSWDLPRQRRAAGEGDVCVCMNSAVSWKTIPLRALQGCPRSAEIPMHLGNKIWRVSVSPGNWWHLL